MSVEPPCQLQPGPRVSAVLEAVTDWVFTLNALLVCAAPPSLRNKGLRSWRFAFSTSVPWRSRVFILATSVPMRNRAFTFSASMLLRCRSFAFSASVLLRCRPFAFSASVVLRCRTRALWASDEMRLGMRHAISGCA